jgi:hypothetical protein
MIHTGEKYDNDVYYRLYLSSRNSKITVVTMQHFDEYDYHDSNFVRNIDGEKYYFDTEEEAIEKLFEWYKTEEIDPEYLKGNTNGILLIK